MTAVRSFGRVKVSLGQKHGKSPWGNSMLVDDEVTTRIGTV